MFVGCGSQEENLHRRSNLFQCLEDSYNQFRDSRTWSYPIPEVNIVYKLEFVLQLFDHSSVVFILQL